MSKRVTVANLVEAMEELRTWSPEGDTPDFERLMATIAYNVKVGQYDSDDVLIEFN